MSIPVWDVEEQEIFIMDVQPRDLQQLCDTLLNPVSTIINNQIINTHETHGRDNV